MVIIRHNPHRYKWARKILQSRAGSAAKINLTLFLCASIMYVRITVTNYHRTEVLPYGMDDRIR